MSINAINTNGIKLFAFDLDGTLYLGDNPIPGSIELIKYLQGYYQVVFFSNTSVKTSTQVHDKLNKIGFKCSKNFVYTSSSSTVDYLLDNNITNIYLIGSKDFQEEIEYKGIKINNTEDANHIVVGLDKEFNYNKLSIALTILLKKGLYIVCNKDKIFPSADNKYFPGCGAIVESISYCSGRQPDICIGKPNTYMIEKISKEFGVSNKEIMVVGDSYESDIQMAINYECKSILVGNENITINKLLSLVWSD